MFPDNSIIISTLLQPHDPSGSKMNLPPQIGIGMCPFPLFPQSQLQMHAVNTTLNIRGIPYTVGPIRRSSHFRKILYDRQEIIRLPPVLIAY